MRFSQTQFFALLPLLFAACTAPHGGYTKLRATDFRGGLVAEWVARGPVVPVEKGYRITAVERLSGPPLSQLSRYPEGWCTTVTGPHITRWRCGEPLWLYESSTETSSTSDFKYAASRTPSSPFFVARGKLAPSASPIPSASAED